MYYTSVTIYKNFSVLIVINGKKKSDICTLEILPSEGFCRKF